MAIGVRNSYATTQAPEDNILQSMQYVDQLDYRAKKDQALQDQAKAKKAEENLKEIDDYRNKFGVNLTGNQSVNDLVIPYASQARDKAADLTKRIQLSSNNQEKAQLMAERNRIVQSFDVLKQVPDVLNAKAKEIADGVEKGKYNERDVDAVQEVLGQLEKGQAHLYVDDNGQARITTFKTDESGNPTGIIEKEQTIVELINSATPYLKPTYDAKGGIAEQFTSQVKLDETEVQKGFTTITQQQLSDRVKEQAKKKGQEVATIDSEVYELWQRMGNDPKRKFSEEDRQKVAEYVEKDLLARYNTTFKKEIDQSGILAQQKFAEEKKQQAIQKAVADYTPIVDEATNVRLNTKNKKIISFSEKALPFKNLGGSKSGLNSGYVTSFVLQDNGDIAITGKALIDKGQKFKVGGKSVGLNDLFALSEDNSNPQIQQEAQAVLDSYNTAANYQNLVRVPSGPQLGQLAAQAGYTSVDELKNELKQLNNNPTPEPKKSGVKWK